MARRLPRRAPGEPVPLPLPRVSFTLETADGERVTVTTGATAAKALAVAFIRAGEEIARQVRLQERVRARGGARHG